MKPLSRRGRRGRECGLSSERIDCLRPPLKQQVSTQMSPRHRMIEDMKVRNLSPATQRSCNSAILKFRRYFGRSTDKLELEDVQAFQGHPSLRAFHGRR
jgi:hypothetical protein